MRHLFIITILSFSIQSSVCSIDFLKELLLPRNPIIHRVRKLNPSSGLAEAGILDFIGLVENRGYPGEEHHVTTEDGYKLTIHRIPGSAKFPPKFGKPVVLLQHGLIGSSDFWAIANVTTGLAYMLADDGYDVWVGNVRGNTYCRSHEQLSTSDPEFWTYSYHEAGFYDLAAVIDYCLSISGETKIYYIGHSMGTTMSYALLSTRPDYNEKIRLVISLAPVAYWKVKPRTSVWKLLEDISDPIKMFLRENHIYDLLPLSDNLVKVSLAICNSNIITQSICTALIFITSGSNPDQLNRKLLPDIITHFPAGTSVQAVDHYLQNIKQGTFQKYDYGYVKNYKIYGKKRAPMYELNKITAPVTLIYSTNDLLTPEKNVLELVNKLPNVELYKIPDNNFNHIDFGLAKNVKEVLNDKILETLSMY